MFKKIIICLLVFLAVTLDIQADKKIWLPIITKGEEDCMTLAILKLSDGTNTIDLLQANIQGVGIYTPDDGWIPRTPDVIPTFQASPLSSGRRLSSYKLNNATETFNIGASRKQQDDLIETIQDFRRLLIQGIDYHVVDWQDSIVYLIARASCETNTRYAHIVNFQFPSDDYPYGGTFLGNKATMEDMAVIIERSDWMSNVPGTGVCQTISSSQSWDTLDEWFVNTAVFGATSLLETSGNDLYAGTSGGDIYKSTNNGDSWVLNTNLGVNSVTSLYQTTNGDIYAGEFGNIYRSQDDGGSWPLNTALPSGQVFGIMQLSNGYLLAGDSNDVWRSTDNGASWSSVLGVVQPLNGVQTPTGRVLWAAIGIIHKSDDNGGSWTIATTLPTGKTAIFQASDNSIYASDDNNTIWKSTDDGNTWLVNDNSILTDSGHQFAQDSNGSIFLTTDDGRIVRTDNNGTSWYLETDVMSSNLWPILIASTERIFVGEVFVPNQLWEKASGGTTTLGVTSDCAQKITRIANKQNIANLTHIKIDDGGAFTDIFPMSSFPTDLLPASPAVNDAVYFGIESSVTNSGPFLSLVFDLSSILEATGVTTLIWEIYTGAWVALTTQDNTNGTGNPLTKFGVNSVHWVPPGGWTTVAVDGVTAYWVRLRVTASSGVTDVPAQQNRQIYTIVNPFVEISSSNIGGDIPALARIRSFNESDADGKSGSSPDLWSNRVLVGLRSTSRGSEFRSFINLSDEQNVNTVSVAAGANTVFTTDVIAPSGRRMTYSAAIGDVTFVDRATISFGSDVVRDYYGTFHAFLRGNVGSGSAGDIVARLQLKTSSGGIIFTSDPVSFQTTSDWEKLDFGAIVIPAGGRAVNRTEFGDEGTLSIQIKNTSGATRTVKLYDLVIIPTDEWAGDFTDKADTSDSIIGRQNDIQHFIDIDSVTNPKVIGRSIVRLNDADEKISAVYEFATNGEIILQANANQQFHFLSAELGSSGEWISHPSVAWSIEVFKNQRYLSFRGSR